MIRRRRREVLKSKEGIVKDGERGMSRDPVWNCWCIYSLNRWFVWTVNRDLPHLSLKKCVFLSMSYYLHFYSCSNRGSSSSKQDMWTHNLIQLEWFKCKIREQIFLSSFSLSISLHPRVPLPQVLFLYFDAIFVSIQYSVCVFVFSSDQKWLYLPLLLVMVVTKIV